MFIFGGKKPLSPSTINRRKLNACKLTNIRPITLHQFRHSHATLLLSKGVPINVISQRLGHSNIEMTLKVYSHLIPEDETRAIDLLDFLHNEQEIKRKNQENESKEYIKTPINREFVN